MSRVRVFSFGYLPRGGSVSQRLKGRLFGYPNLLKRLQAPYLFSHLKPEPNETLLDLGCGGGFFSAEMAQGGAAVHAVDVVDQPRLSGPAGRGRVEFTRIRPGEALPFPSGFFDKILVSELLMVLDDPLSVFIELARVLKSSGKIFVLNSIGRIQIKEAYQRNSVMLRLISRFESGTPESYSDFIERNVASDVVVRDSFPTIEEVWCLMREAQLNVDRTIACCRGIGFTLFYWMQFLSLASSGSYRVKNSIFRYLLLAMLNRIWPRRDPSAVLFVCKKSVSAWGPQA